MTSQDQSIALSQVLAIAETLLPEARRLDDRGSAGPEWGVIALRDAIAEASSRTIEGATDSDGEPPEAVLGHDDDGASYAVVIEASTHQRAVIVAHGHDEPEARDAALDYVSVRGDAIEWTQVLSGAPRDVEASLVRRCAHCERWRCNAAIVGLARCRCRAGEQAAPPA